MYYLLISGEERKDKRDVHDFVMWRKSGGGGG